MKTKTSIALSDEVRAIIKLLADKEDRSFSYVLDQFVEASAKLAIDSAQAGKTIKEIADKIKNAGKNTARNLKGETE
jgi:predicted transcriptional regulator